jgi:hypothetical protein
MNNNFMGGPSGSALQNGVSGVGIQGQKTAYGYGVNGQGLNTVTMSGSSKKSNTFGSKGNLHAIQI